MEGSKHFIENFPTNRPLKITRGVSIATYGGYTRSTAVPPLKTCRNCSCGFSSARIVSSISFVNLLFSSQTPPATASPCVFPLLHSPSPPSLLPSPIFSTMPLTVRAHTPEFVKGWKLRGHRRCAASMLCFLASCWSCQLQGETFRSKQAVWVSP